MRASKTALAGLLAVALAGCAHTAPTIVYKNQAIIPPSDLMQDCQHAPRPAGKTVADLAGAVVDERAVVESCDWGDKAALREWASKNAPASAVATTK